MTATLKDLIDLTANNDLRLELKELNAIKDWARRSLNLGYDVGDRVQIINSEPSQSEGGWHQYRECLEPGQTGFVKKIFFSVHHDRWLVFYMPEREWKVARWPSNGRDIIRRYWHGPVDQTPYGYEPPSDYDQKHYPEGRKHTFMFNPEWLEKKDA